MATSVIELESVSPASEAEVVEAVRAAHDGQEPIFLVGGRTALDYGSAKVADGRVLDVASLAKIEDYTPRDMTIVVAAGVRMAEIANVLAAEGQHLPIDVPRAAEATIGGVVATNWSGPRRLGHGTIRDYIIGIHAVDGRGVAFKGGGRVVKNVAGYDFCKLLTGSLGTLGVITKLALKVKPKPECTAAIAADFGTLADADAALTRLAELEMTPVSVDLLVGASWGLESPERFRIVVRVEGAETEIAWMTERTISLLSAGGASAVGTLGNPESESLFKRQIEFADRGAGDSNDGSPMVVKIAVRPSAVASLINQLLSADPGCVIQAHAGNGIIVARFATFRNDDVTKLIVGKLRPAALSADGSLVVVRTKLEGLTSHVVWGGRTDSTVLLEQIKSKFDPRNVLNPGRFAYQ